MRALGFGMTALVMALAPSLCGQNDAKRIDALETYRRHALAPSEAERAAAVELLRRNECQEAVAELVALIERGERSPRVLEAVQGALRQFRAEATFAPLREELGRDAPPSPRRAVLARVLEMARKPAPPPESRATAPPGCGIPSGLVSNLFLLDVSAAMDEHVEDRARLPGSYADRKKLTIMREELIRAIDALPDRTSFNIVAFAAELEPWKRGFLVPAVATYKAEAIAWLRGLKVRRGDGARDARPHRGEDLGRALMSIFDHGRESRADRPDSVFLLSDGSPGAGDSAPAVVANEFRERNRTYRVVLHTIAFGGSEAELLRALATQNGGVFVELGR